MRGSRCLGGSSWNGHGLRQCCTPGRAQRKLDRTQRPCPTRTAAVVQESLGRLRTDHIDLVLLHYSHCWGNICGSTVPEGGFADAWAALEVLKAQGVVRHIGVSNFFLPKLAELVSSPSFKGIDVVQDWCDPLHQARGLRQWCSQHGVVFQAYST